MFFGGLLVAFTCSSVHGAFINQYDGPLNFQCPHAYQAISQVHSIHDNHREDRIFEMTCSDVLPDVSDLRLSQCFWTPNYVNGYDSLLHYSCPTNHYISGMQSIHDNHREDRVWKFYCCSYHDVHLLDCQFTGFTNSYDHVQNYKVPEDKVMKGVMSIHSNDREDRIYEYEICRAALVPSEVLVG